MPPNVIKVDRASRFGNPFTDKGTIHTKSLAHWGWTLTEPPPLAHTRAGAVTLLGSPHDLFKIVR